MKKTIYLLLFSLFIFTSCEKDTIGNEQILEFNTKQAFKVNICHNGDKEITISINAVEAHRDHGDAIDLDGDGYYDKENICSEGVDCDDTNPNINPDVEEICDGVDNNCDGNIDEGVTTTYYADSDGDGYGDPENTTEACSEPNGYVSDNSDCDDTIAEVNPAMEEVCGNEIDDNCNGEIDEECIPEIGDFYQGGVVFYILQPNDLGYIDGETHGLIVALENLGGAPWGCPPTDDDDVSGVGTGFHIGTGAQNTINIVNNSCQMTDGVQSAGELCANYSDGIYSDWFLPSAAELHEIYINLIFTGLSEFPGYGGYWSSTEVSENRRATVYFIDSPLPCDNLPFTSGAACRSDGQWKTSPYAVIPVRAF